jgi:hypothetical protein
MWPIQPFPSIVGQINGERRDMEKLGMIKQLEVFLRYHVYGKKPLDDDRARQTVTFADRVFRRFRNPHPETPGITPESRSEDACGRPWDALSHSGWGDRYHSG